MDKLEVKKEKFKEELEFLKDQLRFIESLPDSVLEKYNYNINKIQNKITRAKLSPEGSRTYILHESGYMTTDGYEKYYICAFKDSYVKFYVETGEKAYIESIDEDGERTLLGVIKSNETKDITPAEDKLFKIYKMKME